MNFKLLKKDVKSRARAGLIKTDHGEIETPVFMPVGTSASVKGVHQRELQNDINSNIILSNTYHLYLRPGTKILNRAGGIHKFMNWNRPILTDSGGYQVYSLSSKSKISEDGVKFQSHIDGSYHFFTPEKVIIQNSSFRKLFRYVISCYGIHESNILIMDLDGSSYEFAVQTLGEISSERTFKLGTQDHPQYPQYFSGQIKNVKIMNDPPRPNAASSSAPTRPIIKMATVVLLT